MINVFLGYPPEYIRKWMEEYSNTAPTAKAETIFYFSDGTTAEHDIIGELNTLNMLSNPIESLVKVEIGTNVTSIEDNAFEECFGLTSITIPKGVMSIGEYAFWGCNNLTSITIPSSVTSIGDHAFEYCGLTSVTISEGMTMTGNSTFSYCIGLTSVTIPSSMTSIGYEVFSGCGNLTIHVPNQSIKDIVIGSGFDESRIVIDNNSDSPSEPEEKYMGPLCFTAEEDNATVGMIGPMNWETETPDWTVSLQISKNEMKTWTPWDGSIVNLNSECENGKLYVKALNPNTDGFFDFSFESAHTFIIKEGKVAASGNIQYLIDPTGERMVIPDYCYSSIFYGCKSLTQAPELPAETLADSCYAGMFSGCKSLMTAPILPATILAKYCY